MIIKKDEKRVLEKRVDKSAIALIRNILVVICHITIHLMIIIIENCKFDNTNLQFSINVL